MYMFEILNKKVFKKSTDFLVVNLNIKFIWKNNWKKSQKHLREKKNQYWERMGGKVVYLKTDNLTEWKRKSR